MWMQSSFGTGFVRVHFGNARWSHAWANQRRLRRRRTKILPRSAQILIVIRKAFAMHVNARSSNHDPNHVLDRNLKHLSERNSSPCEHSQSHTRKLWVQYISQLTLILHHSTWAERTDWKLHLSCIREMIPYFICYTNTHILRSV